MKNFIKQKLEASLLNESVKGGSFVAYHGSKTKIANFSDEFVGSKEAVDQEGPGIYFTSSKEEANRYGEFVYSVILSPRVLLDKTPTNPTKLRPLVNKMVMMAPEWEMHAQNYDENPKRGASQFIESALEYNDTEKDVAQQIWYDFYKNEPVDYVRNMVKMGIDGLLVPKEYDNVTHYIIYNPSIIKTQ